MPVRELFVLEITDGHPLFLHLFQCRLVLWLKYGGIKITVVKKDDNLGCMKADVFVVP